MKLTTLSPAKLAAAIFALTGVAAGASAEDPAAGGQRSWEGFYAGGNIGGAWSTTCDTWEPGNVIKGAPPLANAFYNRNCPNNSAFIGGLQFGYNFQVDRIVWGLDFDYDGWASNKRNRSYTYAGPTPPPNGTYTFNGNVSPSGFGLIHPRIGYTIGDWLPYFTAGTIIAGGSHTSTASFTPVGASSPAASFSGGKNFTSTGWLVGAGIEYGLRGPWSLKAEYLYANLGKGNNTTTSCTASASACAAFSNFSLDSIHNSFTASLFRVGFNYRFGAKPAPVPAAAPPPPPPPSPPPVPPPPPAPVPPKPAALCPDTPPGVAVDKYGCPCDVAQEVHFATDSAVLTAEDQALLDKMIVNLKRLNFVDGEIGGYTDSTGSPAHNVALSQRRAQAVADYLTSHGISSARLTVKGYGEANPVADNKTREGRAHNRRVVIHRTDCNK